MLELMPDLPDNIVGVKASDQVTAQDYEKVLVPAIEAALSKHNKIRLLYAVGPACSGFSAGAMWNDMKTGIAHYTAWEKLAVVTDLEWLVNATRFFGFAMPCPIKAFANSEFDQAKHWVTED